MESVSKRSSGLFLAAVIIGIILASFLLASTLPAMPLFGSNSNSDLGASSSSSSNSGSNSGSSSNSNGENSGPCLSAEGAHKLSETPIFKIQGTTQTSYIRMLVGGLYQNRGWVPDSNSPIESYYGNYITQELSPFSSKTQSSVTIIPMTTFSGYIPALLYTNQIILQQPFPTVYYSGLSIFNVNGQFESSYEDQYTHYEFNENLLRSTSIADGTSSDYYQVPPSLKPCLDEILSQIDLSHATSAYDRIFAIKQYLQSNYVYDLNYTNAPPNVDPVQWFLMTEKRGVCANFNSAFVLLLRENGIPSRIVSGYAINPSTDDQIVKGKQAHSWAEVKFENIGWVEFDATGSGSDSGSSQLAEPTPPPVPLKETKTVITSLSSSAIKGGLFLTQGIVTDAYGNPASGLRVSISMKISKEDPTGFVCESNYTNADGTFSITSHVPAIVSVGNYQVIAKTQGNDVYNGSQSDPLLTVNAQTKIKISAVGAAVIGNPFTVEAQLMENGTTVPFANEPLLLSFIINGEQNQITGITNQSGYAELNFASIPQTSDNKLNYTISFEQSGFYLATTTEGQLSLSTPQPTPSQRSNGSSSILTSPLFLIPVLSIIVAASGTAYFFYKKRKPVPQTQKNIDKPLPIETSEKKSRDIQLDILFPQIKPPFQDVWGINEAFQVELVLKKNGLPVMKEIELQLGSEPTRKITTGVDGVARTEFQLHTKGTVTINASCPQSLSPLTAQRSLRVVDYTEEVVSIFKDIFDFEKSKGIPLDQDTSPREFQSVMLGALNQDNNTSIENLVTIFEIADYSIYSLKRVDYEKMFLSSVSIKNEMPSNLRCDG
jgi:transglutaminase-like putative cysteine protease